MTNITFPSNTREVIDSIREAIGREVTFYVEQVSLCPVCSGLDPYTGYALDPFCTTCSGLGKIITYSGTNILAHITWGTSEEFKINRGGIYEIGECTLQIAYSDENKNLVDMSKYIVVDSKKVKKVRVYYRGVKELNRIVIECKTDS